MAAPPSVVLLDDGELDRVRVILERMGVDFALCRREADPAALPGARDLLISSGRRALGLPAQVGASRPIWLCVHGQDFGELRADLRAKGVHYLVHSAVDQESLRLLLEMLLHGRRDRRGEPRLPLGCEVTLRIGKRVQFARLVELSRGGARLSSEAPLEAGDWLSLELPLELRGPALDALSGHVARSAPVAGAGGKARWSVALELDPLTPEANQELEALLSGEHPGTRISVLAEPAASKRERRRSERRAYKRRVAALTAADASAPRVALGQDLSLEGIRIARQPGLKRGMRLALGLYGASGGAPLVVEAEVVADHGERGLGLAFCSLQVAQKTALAALVASLPPLESLGNDDAESARRLVVSRVLDAPAAGGGAQKS